MDTVNMQVPNQNIYLLNELIEALNLWLKSHEIIYIYLLNDVFTTSTG